MHVISIMHIVKTKTKQKSIYISRFQKLLTTIKCLLNKFTFLEHFKMRLMLFQTSNVYDIYIGFKKIVTVTFENACRLAYETSNSIKINIAIGLNCRIPRDFFIFTHSQLCLAGNIEWLRVATNLNW